MKDPPWLSPASIALAERILVSHSPAFGGPLLAGVGSGRSARQRAQELFAASVVVLAHDGGQDPRLLYANRAALRLWRRRWGEMVGMPSRLTAAPQERPDRAVALEKVRSGGAIRGYGGVRVDRAGRRFRIEGARLWNLEMPREGGGGGQAAAFSRWWWI